MIAIVVGVSLALLAGAGLWIRWLYSQRDRVPELVATIKTVADQRDKHAVELAVFKAANAELTQHAHQMSTLIASLSTALRKATDAKIATVPRDAAAQLAIAGELLSRPCPGDPTAGDAGDRPDGGAPTMQSAGGSGETSSSVGHSDGG